MIRHLRMGIAALVIVALSSPSVLAQRPFENGISTLDFATGLTGPASLSQGPSGEFYVSNIYNVNGNGNPTPIYRVDANGNVDSTWTAQLVDPDVATLNPGLTHLMVGQFQLITEIDISNGNQTTWLSNSALGNLDGLAYHTDGNLLTSAIDSRRIRKVDANTKFISTFANLNSVPVVGFGSIAVDSSDGSVYIAAPIDGLVVKLDSHGNLVDSSFASGFTHLGQLAIDNGFLYVTDSVDGVIHKINLTTQAQTTFVNNIIDFGGALLPLGGGSFIAARQTTDSSDGTLYKIHPMTLSFDGPVAINSSVTFSNHSPADAGRKFFTIFTTDLGGFPLPDGRNFPILFTDWVFFNGTLDGNGDWSLPLSIPNNGNIVGLDLYACTLTLDPAWSGFFGISDALSFEIE